MIDINQDLSTPQILTPVGRLVGGDTFTPQTKDANGAPLTIKNGPNAGQPTSRFYIAVAIPKSDVDYPALGAKIHGIARAGFPTMFDAAGVCTRPKFAWKIDDGDSAEPNEAGKKPCDREGYPGNWILKFGGTFAPTCYNSEGVTLTEPSSIKRGYYVRVFGSVKANGDQLRPGVYLNPNSVQLVAYGEEIHNGPDGAAVFGAAPVAALPAGATSTPPAPSVMPTPAPVAPVAPAPAAPAPVAPVAPAPPPPPPAAPAVDWPLGPKYIVNGQPFDRAALIAAGYTDAQVNALPVA